MSSSQGLIYNKGSEYVSYFTPEQDPPSGTAENPQPGNSKIPKLFQPLTIRGTTFQNRIWLSPLCQYSSDNGKMTSWHMAHLGGIISRGPGLSMIEGTSISPEGRIDPNGVGLWNDEQIQPMKYIVDFTHSQGQKIAIQLFHAGRKASTVAPWLGVHLATEEAGGWPDKVVGPSAEPFDEKHAKPIEMSLKDIEDIKVAWVKSVERALRAGFDVIEVHAAHGYLLHSFLSPASNKRTDKYGGILENRLRFVLEIIELTRKAIPDTMPLFLRLSATDWLEHTDIESWTVKDSVQLSLRAAELGVDFIDVSSGGLHPEQAIKTGAGYQAEFSKEIKEAVQDKALVGAVGQIVTGTQANELLEGGLDAIFSGRSFQKNPGLVWQWAEDLGVRICAAKQIRWGFQGVWRK